MGPEQTGKMPTGEVGSSGSSEATNPKNAVLPNRESVLADTRPVQPWPLEEIAVLDRQSFSLSPNLVVIEDHENGKKTVIGGGKILVTDTNSGE